MKIKARLELTVIYDDGGDDNFDPNARLHEVVDIAVNNGILTGDYGPITVDNYDVRVFIDEITEGEDIAEGKPTG